MLKIITFTIAILLVINSLAYGQNFNHDSLVLAANQTTLDSTKTQIYTKIVAHYVYRNSDSARKYIDLAKKHAKPTDKLEAQLNLKRLEGNLKLAASDLTAAQKIYLEGLKIATQNNDNSSAAKFTFNLSFTHRYELDSVLFYLKKTDSLAALSTEEKLQNMAKARIAQVYTQKGEFKNAIATFEILLENALKKNDPEGIMAASHGIGFVYFRTKKYDEALQHFTRQYQYADSLNDMSSLVSGSINLGLVYYKLKQLKKSEQFHLTAIELSEKVGNPRDIALSNVNLFEQYVEENEFKKAKPLAEKLRTLLDKYALNQIALSFYINYGKMLLYEGNAAQAKNNIQKGIDLANKQQNYPWLRYGYEAMVKADSMAGNYLLAMQHKDSVTVYSDSIKSVDTQERLNELTIKYQTREKDLENKALTQTKEAQEEQIKNRNYFIYSILFFVLLLIGFIVQIYLSRKKLRTQNIQIQQQNNEIKQQAEQLQANIQQINELTRFKESTNQMLVHDLKKPLNAIMNMPKDFTVQQKDTFRISTAHSMHQMVMNILDVSKYKKTQWEIQPETFSINKVFQKAIDLLTYIIQQKNIQIVNTIKTEIIVHADKLLIERVVENILSNAIKYSPLNGNVQINVEEILQNKIQISIADNGAGIEKEYLPHIFDEYNQAKAGLSGSTGIGLTFCKMAIEAHNQQINIDSEVGKGTTIRFSLLLVENQKMLSQSPKPQVLILSVEEKQALQPYYEELKDFDLERVSAFRFFLKQIIEQTPVNPQWLSEIKNAAISQNTAKYNELVEKLKL